MEDKQVLSIEAQLTELRAFARNENLEIIEELIEKQPAKIPGRPIFNQMVSENPKSCITVGAVGLGHNSNFFPKIWSRPRLTAIFANCKNCIVPACKS